MGDAGRAAAAAAGGGRGAGADWLDGVTSMYRQASVVQAMLESRVFRTPGPVVDVILEDGETPNRHRGKKREQAGYARTMRYAIAFDGKDFDSGEEKVELGRTWRVDGSPHQRQVAERIAAVAREAQANGESLVLWKRQYEEEGERRFDLVWAERAGSRPSDGDGGGQRSRPAPQPRQSRPEPQSEPREQRPSGGRASGHPLRDEPRGSRERLEDPAHGEPFGAPEPAEPQRRERPAPQERSAPAAAAPSGGGGVAEVRAQWNGLEPEQQRWVRAEAKEAGVRIATNPQGDDQVATVLELIAAAPGQVNA